MFAIALLIATASHDPVPGIWEGSSLCEVKSSPCRGEHVLYRIGWPKSRHYRIDAYKLVAGQQQYMGPVEVTLDTAGHELHGPIIGNGRQQGQLRLTLKGTHLSGRMTLADGRLYRLIEVDKH